MDISPEEKNRRLMEKIKNRQNEIKKNTSSHAILTTAGSSNFVSPDKRDNTQSDLNINTPDVESKFPLTSLHKKNQKPRAVINGESSMMVGDENNSLDYNTTLMNMTNTISDFSAPQMQKTNSQNKQTSAFSIAPKMLDPSPGYPSFGNPQDTSLKKLDIGGELNKISFMDSFQQGSAPSQNLFKDIIEEEFDLSEHEIDTSIRDMAVFTIQAATEAGVYTQKEDAQYEFDKISEKDEDEEEEANLSSGGPGNDTSAKKPQAKKYVEIPKLKFGFLEENEPLRVKKEESAQGSSMDSVDKLWQQALNMDDDQNMFFEEDIVSPKNDKEIKFEEQEMEQQQEEEIKENEEEQLEKFEQIKKDNAKNYHDMMKNLISFDFPSTDPKNQENINLKKYHKYFESSLHLAPSTDYNSKLLMHQLKQKERKSEQDENYQQLGCIGFYGIQNSDDVLISMIILNTCSDIVEVQSSSFNNIQQFMVPDLQMMALKNALKKILQNITTDFEGERNKENNDLLGEHIMKKADFGVLLIMGKQYFHACKFKQSIYCINMAKTKCKTAPRINKRDLEEALLWLCIVQMVYFTNRIRIYKKNLENKQVNVQGAQEMFDVFKNLKDAIYDYEEIKSENSKMLTVILYIKLKLEIFRQSDMFGKIIKIQIKDEAYQTYINTGSSGNDQDFQIDGDKNLVARNMVSNSIDSSGDFSRSQLRNTSNMQTFLGAAFQSNKSGLNSLMQSEIQVGPGSSAKSSMTDKETKSVRNKMRGIGARFREKRKQAAEKNEEEKTVEIKSSANQEVEKKRIEALSVEDYQIKTQTKLTNQSKLDALVKELSKLSPYIGKVAMSEVHFMKTISYNQRAVSTSSMGSQGQNYLETDSVDFSELQKGIQILDELIQENPTKILASIKLWQFYRTQGQINCVVKDNIQDPKNEELQENFDQALQIAERLQYNFKHEASEQDSIEAQILITLILVKSLYDSEQYQTCFEMLQREYLRNTKYTGFLYLYGKYVIKSNKTAKYKNTQEQKQFLGSGIGALEECLKSSMPEFHSRINYYIGLAYNRQNTILNMPLKSIHYWQEAQNLGFYNPYQGLQKIVRIKKFLDQHSFIQLIVNLINKSIDENQDLLDDQVNTQNATLAKQYLSVLSTFQEKFDGPSSLILKSHIYAYTLKRQQEAQECFRELQIKYPRVISGYLEHWDYLSRILKKKKKLAKTNYEKAKALPYSKAAKKEAYKDQKDALSLLAQIRHITQKALQFSNVCVHVSTSEWVRVRQMAAKTYLLDKKFSKAIHILTDLCYVIPSNMLKINNDNANLTIYDYDDEANKVDFGGIRFCNQILAEDEEQSDEEIQEEKQEESPNRKNKQQDQFKNMIFIDKKQEEQIRNDFGNKDDEEFGKKSADEMQSEEMDVMKFSNDRASIRKAQHLKTSTANAKAIYNYNVKMGDQTDRTQSEFDQSGLFLAPMETDHSNWDLTDFVLPTDALGDRSMTTSIISNNIPYQDKDDSIRPLRANFQQPQPNQSGIDLEIEVDNHSQEAPFEQNLTYRSNDVTTPKNTGNRTDRNTTKAKDKISAAIFNPNKSINQVDQLGSKTIKLNKKIAKNRASMISSNSRGSKRSFNIFHTKSKQRVSRAFSSVFDMSQFNDINLMLRNKKDPQENEENLLQSNTIFAVNSDVYFLYMIGKMCAKSGHNLFQGLQALNDFYLLIWHNGATYIDPEDNKLVKKSRNPLNNQSNNTGGGRIKQCIKALCCIAQIYERLEQPLLAQQYYFKILEDRENLTKNYDCKKYIKLAETGAGIIFSSMIGNQIPHNLGQFDHFPDRLFGTEKPVEKERNNKIEIDLNYF